jgi:hypothetical protein
MSLNWRETASIYSPGGTQDVDKNEIPTAPALVSADVDFVIERGGMTPDEALSLGLDANLAAVAFCPIALMVDGEEPQIKNGYFILDERGEWWVVNGRPSKRLGDSMQFVRMTLQKLPKPPDGLV